MMAAQQQQPQGDATSPRWYPKRICCCGSTNSNKPPFLYGYPEALGWLLTVMGRAVYWILMGAFTFPALVYLATEAAGCETEIPEGENQVPECNNTVYGMRPSSLIRATSTVINVCVAGFLPLLGAIVDYTTHRRLIGRILSAIFVLLIIPQTLISSTTWFAVQIVLMVVGVVMFAQDLVVHAYLPEITNREEEMNQMLKTIGVLTGTMIVVSLLVVLVIATLIGMSNDHVVTARIAAIVSLVLAIPLFGISWGYLMEKRPAANTLQPGQKLITAGFQQIYKTSQQIYSHYKALGWFYVAIVFGDVKPVASIILTYYTDQLQFTPTETGLGALLLLLCAIPGSVVSAWLTTKFNPIVSCMVSMACMILFSCLGAGMLIPGSNRILALGIAAGWGIGAGIKGTSSRMLVSAITPQGQEAELMGFYLFADSVLSWLPPLVFTAINESGISQRWGLASLVVYFVLALAALWKMGDYRSAVAVAGRLVVDEDNQHNNNIHNNEKQDPTYQKYDDLLLDEESSEEVMDNNEKHLNSNKEEEK